MSILGDLRERISTRGAPAVSQTTDEGSPAPGRTGPPIKGYDRLDSKEVIAHLHHHTQAELTAIEEYERANENRTAVLDKLRYMRGAEPMPDYDALSTEQITVALQSADINTIKAVRAYEQKFANRREVMDAVVVAHRAHHAATPPKPVPAYQAGGGKPKPV